MGANEKFDAATHGGEYVPATENVEHSYVAYRSSKVDLITGHHEFTRWLETLRAEAKAEALNEAADQVSSIDGREDHAARDWLRNRANQMKEEVNGR